MHCCPGRKILGHFFVPRWFVLDAQDCDSRWIAVSPSAILVGDACGRPDPPSAIRYSPGRGTGGGDYDDGPSQLRFHAWSAIVVGRVRSVRCIVATLAPIRVPGMVRGARRSTHVALAGLSATEPRLGRSCHSLLQFCHARPDESSQCVGGWLAEHPRPRHPSVTDADDPGHARLCRIPTSVGCSSVQPV